MIVFDLKCAHDHVFEAWFGSSEDFEQQKARGLIICPLCGDTDIGKALMAPAVPAKSNQSQRAAPVAAEAPSDSIPPEKMREFVAKLAEAQAEALKSSEWVGDGFAAQARAMHYGEIDPKAIHGEVAPKEARDLMDEGVPVAPLLIPVVPPKALN